ncbi:MAG TPA: RtcB family protein [Trebonia sp.]|jgi:tRNA-splicing ligase RtcB|nr:RtcB family protein [Trebonia sp.]
MEIGGMEVGGMEIEVLSGAGVDGADGCTVFDSPAAQADAVLIGRLSEGTAGAGLAAPPVVLPDFCHKAKSEMPSSIAVATTGEIRPALTDAALNCGMALMTLDVARPPESAVTDFYRQVARRFPSPPNWRRELSSAEVLRAATEGAEFAADRYGLSDDELDHIEERGRLDIDAYGGAQRARKELPWLVVQMSRLRFGGIGPSTHFLELQEIEEILDPAAAARLGLHAGQVTVQFHNGGGVLTGQLGELYARRKSASRMLRAEMSVQKPLTHLLTLRPGLRRRMAAYFTRGCPAVPVDGDDGRRVLLATRLAMNYGFAYRMATYAALREMARSAFGASARLVVDSPHNSIYEEQVGGQRAFVHRHNACRAYPAALMADHPAFASTGQPLLLPGTNRTSSYLCVPADSAHRSLYTACHGSGSIISAFERTGRSGPDPLGRTTARYRYDGSAPAHVPQLDDHGVNEALGILTGHGLVRPVARMRPFAVLT